MQGVKQKSKENKPIPVSRHSFLVTSSKQCLQIDKNRINFCKYPIFASSYKQLTINIQLLDYFAQHQKKQFHLLKIRSQPTIKSHGNVFTFKIVDGGQQVTQIQIPIKQAQPLQVHIRATIPQLQVSTDINGTLTLQVDDLMPLSIPITSRGQVPSIICLKQMINKKTGFKMIKIPSKNIMKIPFKNSSNINFFFQLKLVSKQENPDADGVKLRVSIPKFQEEKKKQNPIIKVDANSTFCIQLQFQLLKKDGSIRIARRLLILQVQGTNLFFPFPLQVIISQ